MKLGGGKGKGSSFERRVCADLSLWVSGGTRKDLFWRTAMSGGRATVHRKSGVLLRQSGDICAVAVEGHKLVDLFHLELKHYKKLSLPSFFLSGTGVLAGFWRKVVVEASSYSKAPMIIARQNNGPIFVVLNDVESLKPLVRCMGDFPRRVDVSGNSIKCVVLLFADLLNLLYDGGTSRVRKRWKS